MAGSAVGTVPSAQSSPRGARACRCRPLWSPTSSLPPSHSRYAPSSRLSEPPVRRRSSSRCRAIAALLACATAGSTCNQSVINNGVPDANVLASQVGAARTLRRRVRSGDDNDDGMLVTSHAQGQPWTAWKHARLSLPFARARRVGGRHQASLCAATSKQVAEQLGGKLWRIQLYSRHEADKLVVDVVPQPAALGGAAVHRLALLGALHMKMGACMHKRCVIDKYDIKTQHAVESETHICAHTTCCSDDTIESALCAIAGCRLRCRWASAPCASCLPQPRQTTPPETRATGSGRTLQGENGVECWNVAQAATA